MIGSYKCQSCEKVFPLEVTISATDVQPKSDERCPNCMPITFNCYSCGFEKKVAFENACNVCVQGETLVCLQCDKSYLRLCNGCLYPVCSKHFETLRAFSLKANQKVFFHFCNGYENPKMCFEAFRRLRTNDFDDEDIYYSADWLTHTLSEPRATKKWAARQHFSVPIKE